MRHKVFIMKIKQNPAVTRKQMNRLAMELLISSQLPNSPIFIGGLEQSSNAYSFAPWPMSQPFYEPKETSSSQQTVVVDKNNRMRLMTRRPHTVCATYGRWLIAGMNFEDFLRVLPTQTIISNMEMNSFSDGSRRRLSTSQPARSARAPGANGARTRSCALNFAVSNASYFRCCMILERHRRRVYQIGGESILSLSSVGVVLIFFTAILHR